MSIKIEHISRSIVKSFIQLTFIVQQVEGYQNLLELSCRPLGFTSYQVFSKIIRGLELVFLPHFSRNFWRKILLLLYSINWLNFTVWLPLIWEILGNMCFAIVCKPGCDVMNVDVNLSDQATFPTWPKSCDKN